MTSQGRRDNAKSDERFEDLATATAERISEFSRFLQSRRMEVQEEPFRGFNSPPGRF